MQATHQTPTGTGPLIASALIESVENLTALIEQETSLLRAMKIQEMNFLQEEKMSLINSYEMEMRSLQSRPGFLESLDSGLRAELREALGELNTTLKENEGALLASKTANERLMKAVAMAACKKASPTFPYGSSGLVSAQKPAPAAPVHLNQCL